MHWSLTWEPCLNMKIAVWLEKFRVWTPAIFNTPVLLICWNILTCFETFWHNRQTSFPIHILYTCCHLCYSRIYKAYKVSCSIWHWANNTFLSIIHQVTKQIFIKRYTFNHQIVYSYSLRNILVICIGSKCQYRSCQVAYVSDCIFLLVMWKVQTYGAKKFLKRKRCTTVIAASNCFHLAGNISCEQEDEAPCINSTSETTSQQEA